jgi:hypothetical protein
MVSDGDACILRDAVPVGAVEREISGALSDLLLDIPVSLFPTVIYLPIPVER